MNFLVDTHILLWFLNGDQKLSKEHQLLIEDTKNKKFVRIASLWEIAIKLSLKKLQIPLELKKFVALVEDNGFIILPITVDHILTMTHLDFHHRDPFDRIIVAQSEVEKFTVLTQDENIKKYSIKFI